MIHADHRQEPLSLDPSGAGLEFIEAGGSRRAAARHFRISASSAVRIAVSRAERGTLEPRKQDRPPGQGKLAAYVGFLAEVVEAPDITLDELAAALEGEHEVHAHPASISRVLRRRHRDDRLVLRAGAPARRRGQEGVPRTAGIVAWDAPGAG